jgi:hypothetical protein
VVNYESLLYGKRHLSAVCPIFIVMIYDYDTLPDLGFVGFGAVVGSVVCVVGELMLKLLYLQLVLLLLLLCQ